MSHGLICTRPGLNAVKNNIEKVRKPICTACYLCGVFQAAICFDGTKSYFKNGSVLLYSKPYLP